MYVASDPRSAMAAPASETNADAPVAPAGIFPFDDGHPFDTIDTMKSWFAPAANFIVVYSQAVAGQVMAHPRQPDEYMLILPERDTRLSIDWNGAVAEVQGHSIVFVPGGTSAISVLSDGPVVRFFTRKAADIVARCEALCPGFEPDPNVPPFTPWPDPAEGFRVRSYSLEVEPQPGRFGRIFRCTNFMVNFVYPRTGPRDRALLSPHKHDDFQQCSLCLAGQYVHHIRWPWGTNADTWREDAHAVCGAPSVAIIPARALHTSEAVDPGINQLVDIFCPPREDFTAQPGWVLNAGDYPVPHPDGAATGSR